MPFPLGRYRCRSSPYQHCYILLYGFALRNMRMTADRRLLWIAFAIAIPLQPLVFYLIRIPLDYAIQWQFGSSSTTYAFLKTWFAPVTEELAKLIPLLVPAIFRDVSKSNFVRMRWQLDWFCNRRNVVRRGTNQQRAGDRQPTVLTNLVVISASVS